MQTQKRVWADCKQASLKLLHRMSETRELVAQIIYMLFITYI